MHDTNPSVVVIRFVQVNAAQADLDVSPGVLSAADRRAKILDKSQGCHLAHYRVAVQRQCDHEQSSSSTLHPQRLTRITSAPPQLFT